MIQESPEERQRPPLDFTIDAEIADFLVHDIEFRTAVNNIDSLDRRKRIFEILDECGSLNGNYLNAVRGRLIAWTDRSDVRKKLLEFLEKLQREEITEKFGKPAGFLTEIERKEKVKAKELYRAGNYREALALGLRLIQQNPRLNNDPGTVGFIAHCYNRLDDLDNAYLWAQRALEMSSVGEEVTAKLDIVIRFYFDRGMHEEIMELTEKYPCCKKDRGIVKLIAKAAFKLKRYKEALDAAKHYVFYCVCMKWPNLEMLEIGMSSAMVLKDYAQGMRFCKLYLKTAKSLFVLQIAAIATAKLGDAEAARAYKTEAEELERQIDFRALMADEEDETCM